MASKNVIDSSNEVDQIQSVSLNASFCDIIIEEKKKVIEEVIKYGISHIFWINRPKLS